MPAVATSVQFEGSPHLANSRMQTAGPSHSAVTAGDLELLDVLTSMPSTFPHQSHYPSSATRSKPLSTLNALRRPPIDPMVLAASLSSGPHVTRHHFHHSFGDQDHVAGKSQQMPASQRASLSTQSKSASPLTTTAPQLPRSRRPSAASGSYANCDFDDFEESTASTSAVKIEPVPEVTDEERAYYASRQAPRSVRLQREQELEKKLNENVEKAKTTLEEQSPAAAVAKQQEVAQASDIRASDEPARPDLLNQPGNQAGKAIVPPSTTSDKIAKSLDERKAAVVASASPHLGTLPPPGAVSAAPSIPTTPLNRPNISSIVRPPPIMVRCYARTRIPTPHGEIFCHLYKNNHDAKEHLALVIDPYQNDEQSVVLGKDGRPLKEQDAAYQQKALRSRTLDEVWGPEETDMERIVRGAYVGRLGPSFQVASKPLPRPQRLRVDEHTPQGQDAQDELAPLVRIHSECFTGETIGSQRCDCGEQLDEAIRLISEAYDTSSSSKSHQQSGNGPAKRLGRGVVVYLRQEGRGIGLLDKLMAYNLQDMGHDTVSANILLGHLPDARKYDIASAILRDLGVEQCRLLTNNPEKMEALEAEGVRVTERVGMVPRVWKFGKSVRRRKTKASRRKQSKASSGTGTPSKTSSLGRPAAGRKGPSLLRQISFGGMDSSVISQAGTSAESDSEVDSTTAGLRHQGEDVVNPNDRFDTDDDDDNDDVYDELDEEEYGEAGEDSDSGDSYVDHVLRRSGTTMIGASITKGPELEKYLRTKVERMGHLLTLPDDQDQDKKSKSKDASSTAANSNSYFASGNTAATE